MTTPSDPIVDRLARLADPTPAGDWLDVQRRVRRARLRTVTAAAAALAVLAVALPASGLGERLVSWLEVQEGAEIVPPAGRAVRAPFVYGDRLFVDGRPAIRLAAPLHAPLLGTTQPLVVGSTSSALLAYHAWEPGPDRSGTPVLRVVRPPLWPRRGARTRRAIARVARGRGARLHARRPGPLSARGNWTGCPRGTTATWSSGRRPAARRCGGRVGRPQRYVVSASARDGLLVTVSGPTSRAIRCPRGSTC